jgi:hypothetical protein
VRNAWLSAALVVVSLAALVLQFALVGRTGFFVGDFSAFYCASKVAAQHQDPYLTEPLRTCELQTGSAKFFKYFPGLTTPAPLPGYVFAALRPLTFLAFPLAASLWICLLILAFGAAVFSIARFASVSWQIPFSALSLSLGVLSIPFGEIVPLCIGFICLAAYFASKGRWLYAACGIAGAFIEPHLALPATIGLAIYARRARLDLAVVILLLGLLSLATIGLSTNLEYFLSVLPAHILSEIFRDTQYSLTEVLVSLGAPIGAAIKVGTVSYLAMVAVGVFAGQRLAKQTGNAAFSVCIPPAFAVFGGTFIHATQIAVAIPATILFASYADGKRRTLAICALLALSVPWGWVISLAILLAPVFPVGYLAWRYWGNLRAVLVAAVASAALALLIVVPHRGPLQKIPRNAVSIDARLAEHSWGAFTQTFTRHDPVSWILRSPTWSGLFLILIVIASEAFLTSGSSPKKRASVHAT